MPFNILSFWEVEFFKNWNICPIALRIRVALIVFGPFYFCVNELFKM